MNLRFYIFFLFQIIGFSLYGQDTFLPLRPYAPIEIKHLGPDFYLTIKDTSSIYKKTDGYNHLSFSNMDSSLQVIDSAIYVFLDKKNEFFLNMGCMLQKRSIGDGSLLWEYHVNEPIGGHRQAIKHIYKDEKGRLIALGTISKRPITKLMDHDYYHLGYDSTLVTRRVFDDLTGRLIHEYIPPLDDNSIQILFTGVAGSRTMGTLEHKGDTIIHYRSVNINPGIYLLRYSLDTLGHSLYAPDTFKYLTNASQVFSARILRFKPNRIMVSQRMSLTKEMRIVIMDDDFSNQKEIFSTPIDSIGRCEFPFLVDDRIYFISSKYKNPDFFYTYFEIDTFGALRYYTEEHVDTQNTFLVYDKDRRYVQTSRFTFIGNQPYVHYDLRSFDNDGSKHIIRSMHHQADSMRSMVYNHTFLLDPETLLLGRFEYALVDVKKYPNYGNDWDRLARAVSIMKIKLHQFLLPSIVEDDIKTVEVIPLTYPNPTSDRVGIQFENNFDGIIGIYDERGRWIKSVPVLDSPEVDIDMSRLSCGTYFLVGFDAKTRKPIFKSNVMKI